MKARVAEAERAANLNGRTIVLFSLALAQDVKERLPMLTLRFRRGDAVLEVENIQLKGTIESLEILQRHWATMNVRRQAVALQRRIDELKAAAAKLTKAT